MRHLLERYGYLYTGSCNCDGHATEKYMRDQYLLRIRIKQNSFKIKHRGRSLGDWQHVRNIQQTLSNLHNVAVQA